MKKNLLGIALAPISILSVFGVGFSGFVFEIEGSKSIETELKVAEVNGGSSTPITVFTSNPSISKIFEFSQYGFRMSDDTYNIAGNYSSDSSAVTGGYLEGNTKFSPSVAKEAISSLKNNNKVDIRITLLGSTKIATSNVSATSFTMGNYTYGDITPDSEEGTISRIFHLTNVNLSSTSLTLSYRIVLKVDSQTNFSTFYTTYNGTGKGFKIRAEALEASN